MPRSFPCQVRNGASPSIRPLSRADGPHGMAAPTATNGCLGVHFALRADLHLPRSETISGALECLPMTVVLHTSWHECGTDTEPSRSGQQCVRIASVSGDLVSRACFRILFLSCDVWSGDVHGRMSLSRAVVTQLVTRPSGTSNTLEHRQ